MVLVFLVPVPATPFAQPHYLDKLVHLGVFLGFALLLHIDRASRVWWTLLTSFAFAAGIELVQWVIPYRTGSWWDFVAGATGACVGALLVGLVELRLGRSAREG
jgi:VanZ family protein